MELESLGVAPSAGRRLFTPDALAAGPELKENLDDNLAHVAVRLENGVESAVLDHLDQRGSIEVAVGDQSEVEGHVSVYAGEEPFTGCFYARPTRVIIEP